MECIGLSFVSLKKCLFNLDATPNEAGIEENSQMNVKVIVASAVGSITAFIFLTFSILYLWRRYNTLPEIIINEATPLS